MAAAAPGQYNTFLPNIAATKKLIVEFSRNPKDFPLAQYVQYADTKQNVGRYLEMLVEQAGRIVQVDLADAEWGDGQDAPDFAGEAEMFEYKGFTTKRYARGFRLGSLAVDQADWDIVAQNSRIATQRTMTGRTQLVQTLLQTVGNWPTGNTADLAGTNSITGKHDVSTTARKDIKRSLDYGADVIKRNTLSAVKPSDLIFVCSPGYARKISVCQEIVDHIKGSTDALKEIKDGIGPNAQFGLPSTLYGYPVRVEDTVKVTTRRGSTTSKSYIMSDAKPMLLSRPGGLEAPQGPSFSTVTLYFMEEMTVEDKYDADNRVHKGRVVDDFAVCGTALAAGFLFQNATS